MVTPTLVAFLSVMMKAHLELYPGDVTLCAKTSELPGSDGYSSRIIQGSSVQVSKSPFLTMGSASVQLGGVTGLVVVWVIVFVDVYTVVGVGVAVRMQEQALLSREGGKAVVAGKSRLAGAAAVTVLIFLISIVNGLILLQRVATALRSCLHSGYCGAYIGATERTRTRAISSIDKRPIEIISVACPKIYRWPVAG